MKCDRSAGILCPIFSLPSPYGIGTLGKAAYDFVDFLKQANQSYWQILPVNPTSFGDSPYQCFSGSAGNPYFIDLDLLVGDGLLSPSDIKDVDFGKNPSVVDYGKLFENRIDVLRIAAKAGISRDWDKLHVFIEANQSWLPDYAMFMALKTHFSMKPWTEWEDRDIRLHDPSAIWRYSCDLADEICFYEYIQYVFWNQWDALHTYASKNGISIIGDIPLYVSMDSADVWANPHFFKLNSENIPTEVSGVPPDYFSEDGQLWGNPLYNWDAMKDDGYGWWIRRIDNAFKLYDVIRIDHFRGFESYWSVPYGETTAKNGHWEKGPGLLFVDMIMSWFCGRKLIAEDLGILNPEAKQLLSDSGLPGMKLLQFAFGETGAKDYLPHTYEHNCVCYAGTHDNPTIMEWKKTAPKADVEFAVKYLGLNDKEGFNFGILRAGLSSVSHLFVAQIQDYLGLGAEARINTPGEPYGNWQWRLTSNTFDKKISEKLAKRIAEYTHIYQRDNALWLADKESHDKEILNTELQK